MVFSSWVVSLWYGTFAGLHKFLTCNLLNYKFVWGKLLFVTTWILGIVIGICNKHDVLLAYPKSADEFARKISWEYFSVSFVLLSGYVPAVNCEAARTIGSFILVRDNGRSGADNPKFHFSFRSQWHLIGSSILVLWDRPRPNCRAHTYKDGVFSSRNEM